MSFAENAERGFLVPATSCTALPSFALEQIAPARLPGFLHPMYDPVLENPASIPYLLHL